MEKVISEHVPIQVKLFVSKLTKFYQDESAIVEIVKCLTNEKTGEVIRQDFVTYKYYSNRGLKEYDKLLNQIAILGEEAYFKGLLEQIEKEQNIKSESA